MTNPTFTFFLDQRRELNGGYYPIKMTVYYLGDKKRYKTKFFATASEYEKIQSSKLRDESLKKQKTEMYSWLKEQSDMAAKIAPFSIIDFEAVFLKEKKSAQKPELSDSLKVQFDIYIASLKKKNRITTATTYQTAFNSIDSFKKNLKFAHITDDFLDAYEQWMILNKKSLTTVGFYLRALRAIYNIAMDKGIIEAKLYPFKKYTIPAPRKSKRALKKEEIKMLLKHQATTITKQRALDFWIFSFICNGINFKDIALLKNENIQGDFIEFRRAKTINTKRQNTLPIRVPISEMTKEIIKKWGSTSKEPDDYIFPILEHGMNAEQIEKRVDTFIRNTNKSLNKIGANDLKLSLKLTTMVSRHSFATTQKNNNVSRDYLKESLGHSNIQTTENYLSSFEDEDLKTIHAGLMEGLM